eukprot:m.72499 g.72499  ORF g.72499 m.72499 type:complete len:408 (+) comp20259_c0_seq3:59-1282(+)
MYPSSPGASMLLFLLFVTVQASPFYDTTLPILSEVTWLPEPGPSLHAAQRFVGSPSLVQTDAAWLASHDRFFDVPHGTAYVYASSDLIEWTSVANITSMYWAQLFNANNQTYIIGTSDDMSGEGNICIARCLTTPCDGKSWSETAVLFKPEVSGTKYHCAPTPVVEANGTLYRAFDLQTSSELQVLLLSAPSSCPDLTSPTCWTKTAPISPPSVLTEGSLVPDFAVSNGRYWEEPGAIAHANGSISVMVRIDALGSCTTLSECNRAVLLQYDARSHELVYDQIVQFPSSCNKFAVRRADDGYFYSLTNPVTLVPVQHYGLGTCGQRNTAVLTRSKDLYDWKVCQHVLHDDTGLQVNDSLRYTGLQYIDFRFSGDDIIAAVRSGYRGSTSYHDANRLLIVKVDDFKNC